MQKKKKKTHARVLFISEVELLLKKKTNKSSAFYARKCATAFE